MQGLCPRGPMLFKKKKMCVYVNRTICVHEGSAHLPQANSAPNTPSLKSNTQYQKSIVLRELRNSWQVAKNRRKKKRRRSAVEPLFACFSVVQWNEKFAMKTDLFAPHSSPFDDDLKRFDSSINSIKFNKQNF